MSSSTENGGGNVVKKRFGNKNKIKMPKPQGPDFDLSIEELNGGLSPLASKSKSPEEKKDKKKVGVRI